MQPEIIQIGRIEVEVSFKAIKNLHLSVHPPDGKVTVSSPDFFDLDRVKIYLAGKLAWIKKEQQKIRSQEREVEKEFLTQESHFYMGKRYLLKVIEAPSPKIILRHSNIELYTPPAASIEQKQNTLYNWYRRELRKKLALLISDYAEKMNLKNFDFGIRKMKTKWGSCVTDSKTLWFNIELAKKPISCIEYVVVHELVHLLERHHNRNFIILMNRYLPGWREQKRLLNEVL
jgi:predicted metal-dependent hydrolase